MPTFKVARREVVEEHDDYVIVREYLEPGDGPYFIMDESINNISRDLWLKWEEYLDSDSAEQKP